MFYNNRVTILSQGEDRALTPIYTDIKAQIYKKTVRLDRTISENTSKEVTMVLIDADKTSVRAGNIIQYTDAFGVVRDMKTAEPEMVKAMYFKSLIRLQCDLV